MDPNDLIARLQASQGDPHAVALVTVDIATEGREDLRRAIEAAAVPHWFDQSILAAMLETDLADTEAIFNELTALPMVEAFEARGGWNVHETTRLALRKHLMGNKPRFDALTTKAAQLFPGEEPHHIVESLFHRLAIDDKAGPDMSEQFESWDNADWREAVSMLGLALEELRNWGSLPTKNRGHAALTLGWINDERWPLSLLLDLAQEAVRLLGNGNNSRWPAEAQLLLGCCLEDQGRSREALRHYLLAKSWLESASRQHPYDSITLNALSDSHNCVGGILLMQGKLDEALVEYSATKQIRSSLCEEAPENVGWQRKLSSAHCNLGRTLQAQGKLADALHEYRSAKEIRSRLIKAAPENAILQSDLSISLNDVGRILQAQGRLSEALTELDREREISMSLCEKDPDNTSWQRDLSISHNSVGGILQAQGKLSEALTEFKHYKAIMITLCEKDPENARWQRELSVAYECVGWILEDKGKLNEALAEYQASLAIAERLVNLDPSNADWAADLKGSREAVDELRQRIASEYSE